MKNRLLLFITISVFTGCSATYNLQNISNKNYPEYKGDVLLILEEDYLNSGEKLADFSGKVDSWSCDKLAFINHYKEEASKMGGNLLLIKSVEGEAGCYSIVGEIWKDDSVKSNTQSDSIVEVIIYRNEGNFIRSMFDTEIYLDDKLICNLKNESKIKLKLDNTKPYKLSVNKSYSLTILPNSKTKYIKATKITGAPSQGIGITFGPAIILEVNDLTAKLEMSKLKNMQPVN